MIAAFHFTHDWSHAAAVQSVKKRALAFTGQPPPYGIWFNYAFLAAWIIDATWLSMRKVIYAAAEPSAGACMETFHGY